MCLLFPIAVPAAKLFISEMSRAIASASDQAGQVILSKSSREEILYWCFLDDWKQTLP